MSTLYIIASSLFFIWTPRNIFFWVSLWQLKEYRFDRIIAHLRETKQGNNLLFSPLLAIKFIGVLSFIFVIFRHEFLPIYQVAVTAIFFYHAVVVVYEALSRLTKRPKITIKAIGIVFVSLAVVIAIYAVPLIDNFFWLLVIDRLIPVIIALIILALSFPTELVQGIIIEGAIKKLRKHKKLLVIGVTGSYGKSSTKEFLAQILSEKFIVLKTKGTNNTPIGIARAILSGLHKGTEIFVVEMGAYKIGEIAEICQIVHPTIGIITAVNDQHLSLFGSIQNTMKAKYELIESLPNDGLSLFNGNNENAYKLYEKTDKKKKLYLSDGKYAQYGNLKQMIIGKNIIVKQDGIEFDVMVDRGNFHLNAPLLGAHNIENILPAIYIAKKLGMKENEIKKAVQTLKNPPKTMTLLKRVNGVKVIDDTFNANPQAVMAAIEYIKIYKKKKILVLQPMIELGKNAKLEHYELGKEISTVCDYLFLTNKNFYGDIIKGIKSEDGKCTILLSNTETASYLRKITERGDIVIFEGKEAEVVLKKFI